jgi:hypothetical protein
MQISISKRFIFLANSKTGSTSIEAALEPYADFVWEGTPKVKHASWIEVMAAFKVMFEMAAYAPEKFMRFGVIREPAEWILSWYNYRRFTRHGGVPKDTSFESFWRSDDWVKRKTQRAHFLDDDGICRFNLIIPLGQLRDALPRLCKAMGIEPDKVVLKNRSKGLLAKNEVSPILWEEINDFYHDDWLLHREWEEKFATVFPQVLSEFYGDGAETLPALPPILQAMTTVRKVKKPKAGPVVKESCESVDLVKIVLPRKRKALGGEFVLKGAVLLKADSSPAECRLLLVDGNGEREIDWGLSSPNVAQRFPNNPLAASCRFKISGVKINEGENAELWLQLPNNERCKLAAINR